MFSCGRGEGGGGWSKGVNCKGCFNTVYKTFPYLPKAVLLCMVNQFDYVLVGVHVDTVVFLKWNIL